MPQLRASHDQTAFSVNKGVKTFDLCGKHSVLVTGGLDRLVRVWNPHFSGWEITMNSSSLPTSPWNIRYFLFLFLFPGNQLVFWKVTVLPSATSASPQRTVRSSPSPSTMPWKWLFIFFNDSFVFCFRNQSLILLAQGFRHGSKTFFSLKLLICLCCGSPGCVSGLGYSGAALFAYTGFWGKWNPWWHYCVLILLCYEIPLCCRWRHGCALPEEKVGAAPLCSVHERTLSCFSVYIWENLSIDLFWFLRDHFHNSLAEQWFSQRFVQIAACLLFIFLLFCQAAPSRSIHYLPRRARDLLRLL